MIFTRNFKIILSALFCFLVSIFSCLAFLLFSVPKAQPLTFTIKDIYLEIGESIYIDYEVNYDDAEVFFSIANTSIALVENNKVVALSEGSTYLRGSASYNGEVCYAGCNIVVSAQHKQNYSFIVSVLNGGYYENNTIFSQNNTYFTLTVVDKNNTEQDIQDILYDTDCISQEFKIFYLDNNFEGVLHFECPSINFSFDITVKKFQ